MLFLKLLLAIYCLKVVMYFILLAQGRRAKLATGTAATSKPAGNVDIVLPMYNEEKVIVNTIRNLLNISYDNFSIIVVDDGSSDQSLSVARAHYGDHERVQIIHQPNAGKSAALNRAMNASKSDFIICIDADTIVRPDVIDQILPYFDDEQVAAVSGYVKVGNRINAITNTQYYEYHTIQNHERIILERVNGILVVPGALGAFRRSAVLAVGGFVSEALAEDCDITLRMLCKNYVIRNAPNAMSFTEAPDNRHMFFKQRVRWTVGLVQGLLKHSRQLSSRPNKALACLVLPYTWIYRVIMPFFAALADYVFLYVYFVQQQSGALLYYLSFILLEFATMLFILLKNGERANWFKLFFYQRYYRHLAFFTYLHILLRWLTGNLYGWSKIPRQGNVKLD